MTEHEAKIPNVPSEKTLDRLAYALDPVRRIVQPKLYGEGRRSLVFCQLAGVYEKAMGFPPPPMVRGVGLTVVPRPERLYFWFGEPIDSQQFGTRYDDSAGGGLSAMRSEKPSSWGSSSCATSATSIRTAA